MKRFEAGYSKTPLHRKLGCRPEREVLLLGAPDGFAEYLAEHQLASRALASLEDVPQGATHVHVFTTRADEVRAAFAILSARLAPTGQAWISWPKRASGVPCDIPKGLLHDSEAAGRLVDVKVCAVDATWSGLKYVIRTELR